MKTLSFDTPIGILTITGDDSDGISSIKKTEFAVENPDTCDILENAKQQLLEYFEGKRKEFNLKLHFGDSPAFHQSVWNVLLGVPFGKTISYSEIANRLNNPKAVRAVGMANKLNKFAIVVPCHRVIGKTGDLTGYFYGLETKSMLLRLENPEKYVVQSNLNFI